jgi:hypothetical protein
MATSVLKKDDVTLLDGTKVSLRPLNIKNLRVLMGILSEYEGELEALKDAKKEEVKAWYNKNFDFLLEAAGACFAQVLPDKAEDKEYLEENLDIPTIDKILYVCGGVEVGGDDPNLGATQAQPKQ